MNDRTKFKSSIIDQLTEGPVPYYDHFLHLQKGVKPNQILWAEESPKDRMILKQHLEQHNRRTADADVNVEVKTK